LRWQRAAALVHEHASLIGEPLVDALLSARPVSETEVAEQRQRIESLRQILRAEGTESAMRLFSQAEDLLRKSVWIVGGDGWAYDIGYGGLDHVLASGDNVRILVLDTEVYSNTGGQSSKATPFGAVARFAANGKRRPKKDLALMAMQYENVYVARVAFGAKDSQTVLAFQEAETFPGPALIIAYAHCQAHGFDLKAGLEHQKLAVDTGYWPLCRFDPRRAKNGVSPLVLDSAPPKLPLVQFTKGEGRFSALEASHPAEMVELNAENQAEIAHRYQVYKKLAESSAAGAAVSETATSVGAKT
jgi:pyruvate-ferredoxin/flavodoxin oxidoreductase